MPDIVVKPRLYAAHNLALVAFDEAARSNATSAYFNSDNWRYLMPALALHPQQLEILRSGIPLIRVDRPGGRRFYVASRVERGELLRRIEANPRGQPIPGIEVCIPVRIR